jgi:6-phosphogluconolactonase
MINKVLFEPLQINDFTNFSLLIPACHRRTAAQKYMEAITRHFNGADPASTWCLLGLGDNSHTASLFPFTTILHESSLV